LLLSYRQKGLKEQKNRPLLYPDADDDGPFIGPSSAAVEIRGTKKINF